MQWDVRYVEQTGSTNADLLELARQGAPPGTVIRAGHQTAGRGRMSRAWQAPAGTSLLASILLPAEPVAFFVVARVALAAADACQAMAGVGAWLKWPNDLVVGDRKLAGLLAEADEGAANIVVGIGCNMAWPLEGRPLELLERMTCLSDHTSTPPAPADLLDGLLARLTKWLRFRPDEVLAAYAARCATLGSRVRVDLGERSMAGTATGLASTGALELAAGGRTVVVHAGDVVHVRAG
ncbi:MAG: biotin--[acetyl-CoA-carboxylase] ligase [Acidimicrobiales bacterium]